MFNISLKKNYLLFLVSIIPFSIILGPLISLINVLIISILFVLYHKDIFFLTLFKKKIILSLLLIYCYLLFNTLISIDPSISWIRNFGFFRFIILFIAINYLFFNTKNINFLYKSWFLICLILLFDSYFEFFLGKNILGFSDSSGARIVSFFKDEPVVASYLNGFIFIILGYLFSDFKNKSINRKFLIFFVLLIFLIFMILSGERSNTIKFIFGILLFLNFSRFINYKLKLFFVFFVILLVSTLYFSSDIVKLRYSGQLINLVDNEKKREAFIKESKYIQLYKSGFQVFKNYPLFGVGNKNYRVEACGKGSSEKYICNTHPHQIYIEFLSEHGVIGSAFLLSVIFYLIFRNFKQMIISQNLIQIGSFCYLIINFLPIIPSGSFFGDFNATFFWLNFSIFYASNFKMNIFKKGELAQ